MQATAVQLIQTRAPTQTVGATFGRFLAAEVNLDPEVSRTARASRDWLRGQLRALPSNYVSMPRAYPELDDDFGSFARRTKPRELDDIDLISCVHAEGATYVDLAGAVYVQARPESRLAPLCDDASSFINSTKVINCFVRHLAKIPQYRSADIHKGGEAATLSLASYGWTFDIVPAFFTTPEADGRTYYIIPNGREGWKKTDPRLDRQAVTSAVDRHGKVVLDVIRLLKIWNRRPTMPTVPSYPLECLLVQYFNERADQASAWIQIETAFALSAVADRISNPIPDPKAIQGDLNSMSWLERKAVMDRARLDLDRAVQAIRAEQASDHDLALSRWTEILGTAFQRHV